MSSHQWAIPLCRNCGRPIEQKPRGRACEFCDSACRSAACSDRKRGAAEAGEETHIEAVTVGELIASGVLLTHEEALAVAKDFAVDP